MTDKNPAAVALGRMSGKRMTKEQRIERARKAGVARAIKMGQKLRHKDDDLNNNKV